jgi:hypothetical protein
MDICYVACFNDFFMVLAGGEGIVSTGCAGSACFMSKVRVFLAATPSDVNREKKNEHKLLFSGGCSCRAP